MIKVSEACQLINNKIKINEQINTNLLKTYISTENMLPNMGGKMNSSSIPITGNATVYNINDTLVSNIRPYFKKAWKADCNGVCSNDVLVFRAKSNYYHDYIYYNFANAQFFSFAMKTSKGTKMPRGDKSAIMQYEIEDMNFVTQKKATILLRLIDNKIELNNKINNNLARQAQALFEDFFLARKNLPAGWKKGSLLDIADYLNGLAMQKYRPLVDEQGIPVLKIKELRQGMCDDSSELCSSNIKSEYIISDGDVIFSWSGSLLVDFWCGGTCGLNQHLFKVTSSNYDKWFYYAWTKYHLNKFIVLASAMATTMGHIKRGELANSEVLIPCKTDYEHIGGVLQPIYDLIIANRIENIHLSNLRDELLPKIMSGELDISKIDL